MPRAGGTDGGMEAWTDGGWMEGWRDEGIERWRHGNVKVLKIQFRIRTV